MELVRHLRAIAAVLLASILLAACGGAAPAAPTTSEAPASEAPASEAPATSDATTTEAETEAPVETSESSEASASGDEPFIFGMIMVGPINDSGWNESHYSAGKYVESKVPGAQMIYIDKVNSADRPNITVQQVIDDLISQGAKFIIANSDDFKDGTLEAAKAHPEINFLHASGDSVLAGTAPENLGNLMGQIEYGKIISGCAAALQTQTGKISYLGPLINDETRRLVNATYLGARYCWENVVGKPAEELQFNVTWIGFWFNIPGVTLDPTNVANDMITAGSDVIISGLDTTEALVEANKASQAGKAVYAIANDFVNGCAQAEDVCLGSPYINWGPDYVKQISAASEGTWKAGWDWVGPNWEDMNNLDTSAVGWTYGKGLDAEKTAKLDEFIKSLADKSLNLYTGPLNFQDGSMYLAEGESLDLNDMEQAKKIWYTPQLLEGIEGQSAP